MVSAVLAADAFAGEKERRTIETLLHLPISDRDLYLAKLLSAYIPAVGISWIGFACYLVVGNVAAWPVMHRIFLPTRLWIAVILWLAPAVAAFGLGIMVRVSARARTSQEANQLGGTVILPLVIAIVAQTSVLLLAHLWVTLVIGAVIWADRHRPQRPGSQPFLPRRVWRPGSENRQRPAGRGRFSGWQARVAGRRLPG